MITQKDDNSKFVRWTIKYVDTMQNYENGEFHP